MSQYYQSNQPYNSAYQQKDGNGNGIIMGGLVGAGAMGAIHKWGDGVVNDRISSIGEKIKGIDGPKMKTKGIGILKGKVSEELKDREGSLKKLGGQEARAVGAKNLIHNNLGKGGNWKTKTMAYGGSALAGMVGGGLIDGMHNSNK